MRVKGQLLSYEDYVIGIQQLTPDEQLNLIEVISENLKTIIHQKKTSSPSESITPEKRGRLDKESEESDARKVWQRRGSERDDDSIILPTKKHQKASMPKVKITGKPLSQTVIEDRDDRLR